VVRFAAMDRLLTYGKIILIGVLALIVMLLDNFHDPNRYTHESQKGGWVRYDGLDGSVEIITNDDMMHNGWFTIGPD